MKASISILILSLLLQVNCRAQEKSEFSLQEDKRKIGQIASKFGKALDNKNADSLAILFAENAHYASNNGYLLVGPGEIQSAFEQWMTKEREILEDSSYVVELQIKTDMAFMLNHYVHRLYPKNGEPYIDKGYALAVFERQEDGHWKIRAMTVNKHPKSHSSSEFR